MISKTHIDPETSAIEVRANTLDDFMAEHHHQPTFLKIDVEGHEPEMLACPTRLLLSFRSQVYMEFNSRPLNAFAGHSPTAFAIALYEALKIARSERTAVDFLHANLTKEGCVSDLLILPKDGASVLLLEKMPGLTDYIGIQRSN